MVRLAGAFVILAAALPLSAVQRASAQQPATGVRPDIQEIVVTARRREEKLQQVPIAVTALTAKALDRQHIENSTDLAYIVPSLTAYSDTGRDEQYFTLRGITNQPGGPGVVAYFNEVPDSTRRSSAAPAPLGARPDRGGFSISIMSRC